MRRRRLRAQDVERLLDLAEAAARDVVAEKLLVAIVVAVRVELEQPVAEQFAWIVRRLDHRVLGLGVDADAGQDARQLLDVLLAVPRADPHRVELHDLARVILVDVAGGVLRVVEVALHRRVAQRRLEQVAEAAERERPNGARLIVTDHRPDVVLVHVDVEVVEPEPRHHLVELVGRVEGEQDRPLGGLVAERLDGVLIDLLRRLLGVGVGHRVRRAVEVVGRADRDEERGGRHRQRLERLGDRLRQGDAAPRMELRVEPARRAEALDVGGDRTVAAPRQSVEQRPLLRRQRRRGDGRAGGDDCRQQADAQ